MTLLNTGLSFCIRCLRNRNILFLCALFLGFLVPQGAPWMKPLVLPLLALVMTLAVMDISGSLFHRPKDFLYPALAGIALSYMIQGNLLIVLGALFIREEAYWIGLVTLASVPPAIAVIPFAAMLGGSASYALMGTIGAYFGALLVMPIIAATLFRYTVFDPLHLATILILLILLPILLSRFILRNRWHQDLDAWKGTLTNGSFFVLLYTMIGLNREALIQDPLSLTPVVLILLVSTFLLGYVIAGFGYFLRLKKETLTSLILLGTLKNQGLAGGIALTLFTVEASVPAALSTVVMVLYILWLDRQSQTHGTRSERR